MISQLRNIYRRQMFLPGWLGVFVNPFYIARNGLHKAVAEFSPLISGRMLDVGCGSKPYQSLFQVDEYVGLDIDSESARKRGHAEYFYDGHAFPFAVASFDAVLCNQVLEHVFNPDEFLAEMVRVLKPGGKLLLTVPFVWDEHEQPCDYARYSSFGLAALLEKQGFRIIHHKKTCADASILFQLANAYLYKVVEKAPALFKRVFMFTVMALINVTGLLTSKALPDNPDLFLDQVVFAEKIS
jgi:SAM-dependent methyltransferase